jgi:hypothetical protein
MRASVLGMLVAIGWAGCDKPLEAPKAPKNCSTGVAWTGGDEPVQFMRPGADCITCHLDQGGPALSSAGTVMGALDDADDCIGIEGVTVQITDADGTLHEMVTNKSGNFYTNEALPTPITVTLVYEDRTTSMLTPQTDTNCMSCHGNPPANAAPGRIVAP